MSVKLKVYVCVHGVYICISSHILCVCVAGKVMKLSPITEETALFFAQMLDHEYTIKEVFRSNFFKDWRKVSFKTGANTGPFRPSSVVTMEREKNKTNESTFSLISHTFLRWQITFMTI